MSFDRRHFLRGGFALGAQGLFGNPLVRLIEAITNGVILKAHAEAAGESGLTNYLNIGMLGAPHRYVFDAWLRPNEGDAALIFNPMTGTRFTSSNGQVDGVIHDTITYKGLRVPYMFGQTVNLSSGAVPLTSYLDNMLVIRGYGTGLDGHGTNFIRQMQPLAGQPSLTGFAADGAKKYFEAVQWPGRGGFHAYFSARSVALNAPSDSRPLHALIDGINSTSGSRALARDAAYENALAEARAKLNSISSTETKASAIARKNLENALALIKKGVGNIEEYWDPAVVRYRTVINNAMRTPNLVGINDVPLITPAYDLKLGPDDPANFTARRFGSVELVGSKGEAENVADPAQDLRTAVANMTTSNLAEGLALAEFLYANGLGSALEITTGSFENLNFRSVGTAAAIARTGNLDMHATGAHMGLLMTTMFYRGLAAGLMELRAQLRNARNSDGTTVWSRTTAQIVCDFGRSARSNGTGSDHGYNQMVTSLFSGAFDNGPEVVGNVHREMVIGQYAGSQGYAAPIANYVQPGIPGPTMMASTLSQALGLSSNPWGNVAQPLVRVSNGVLSTTQEFGRGKVIG